MSSGRCAAGERCRGWDQAELVAAECAATLCEGCLVAGRDAVEALTRDWLGLEQLLPKPVGGWGDGQPRGRGAPPVPLNLGAVVLQRTIWWVVCAWDDVARAADRLSDRGAGREGVELSRAVGTLTPRMTLLAEHAPVELWDYPLADPGEATVGTGGHTFTVLPGWRGVVDVARLHRRAVRMLGLTQPVRRLPGACSGCGQPDLRQDPPRRQGDEQPVYCGSCARRWTYDEYARYAGLWEAAA